MKDSIPLAPLQKLAWFNLIVFAIAVALYLMAVPFFAWHRHMTLAAASLPALGMFGVCGLWGFGSLICGRRKLDEREALINQRAMMLCMQIFWQVFVLSCMGIWAYFSYILHQTTVPVGFFPFLIMLGVVVFYVAQSIAILVQYKRSASDDTL
jgi:hypothetical protein